VSFKACADLLQMKRSHPGNENRMALFFVFPLKIRPDAIWFFLIAIKSILHNALALVGMWDGNGEYAFHPSDCFLFEL
jgi:hypothetical protein